ncbi:hypothetical protein TNCV_2865661 [Trichonephila clavipes]|nr:hypothetical protein TNCV_2865661 [Trichonephila clavipes]
MAVMAERSWFCPVMDWSPVATEDPLCRGADTENSERCISSIFNTLLEALTKEEKTYSSNKNGAKAHQTMNHIYPIFTPDRVVSNMVSSPPDPKQCVQHLTNGQVGERRTFIHVARVSIGRTPLAPGHFKYSCCHGDGGAGGNLLPVIGGGGCSESHDSGGQVTDSWPVCHEFEPATAEDPPCREGRMHVNYVEAEKSSRWCNAEVRRGSVELGVILIN